MEPVCAQSGWIGRTEGTSRGLSPAGLVVGGSSWSGPWSQVREQSRERSVRCGRGRARAAVSMVSVRRRAGRVLEVQCWGFCCSRTPPVRNTFFLASFFRCPAWLKIRCTYQMAEPSQVPLSQGRMGTGRLVGIAGDWEVFLGCLS